MANPLKVLVDLQARRNVAVSGTLEVTGSTALVGNTTVTSLTASSVISGTTGYFTGLYVNGTPVAAGGSGTVSSGVTNKLAVYTGATTVDDAAGLTWDGTKLAVSGATASAVSLEVTGAVIVTDTLSSNGVTVTGNISGSGTLQVGSSATIATGLTVTAGTTAVQALTSTGVTVTGNISGSGTLQAGGALTVAGASTLNGGLTVTGGALNASTVEVSASALNVAGAATVGGNLTVTGDLQVQGTVNAVNRTDLHVTDKVILVASGSANAAAANGSGLQVYVGDASDPSFTWDQNGKWVSTENLDLASSKTYKINGTDVLSSTALGNGITTSSLTTVGILTSLSASGHTAISTLSASAVSGTTGTFTSLAVNGATVATATAVQNAYRALRYVQTGSLAGSTVTVNLTTVDGTVFPDTQKDYVSVNVMVRSGSTNNWQNDLVAVHLSSSGGNLYVLIDALGNDMDGYRLIAVNENDSAFTIS